MPTMSRAESAVRTQLETVEQELKAAKDRLGGAEVAVAILKGKRASLLLVLEQVEEPTGGSTNDPNGKQAT